VSLQGSKKPKQQTESALPGPAGYEPAGLIFLTIGQPDWNGAGYATQNAGASGQGHHRGVARPPWRRLVHRQAGQGDQNRDADRRGYEDQIKGDSARRAVDQYRRVLRLPLIPLRINRWHSALVRDGAKCQ
jgi:hypothetical protein